jgi:hypothetical protein
MEGGVPTRTLIMTDNRKRTSKTPRLIVVGLLILGAACHRQKPDNQPSPVTPAPAPNPGANPAPIAVTSGHSLVQAMHDRYASRWYRSLTHTQKTTLGLPSGGEIVQTWYVAEKLPGHQRIDSDLSSKSGTLFARDSIYSFAGGKRVSAEAGMTELLVLGGDVFSQPVSRTEADLRELGFDLSKFHEATWQGVPVYVVGAVRGDSMSKQFWVERDRLLFVRMLERTRQGHSDTRIAGYTESGGGWVAAEVAQIVNGKRRILERFTDIRTNVTLGDALFDPKQWATATHWVSR